jgi:hypothetical protein
MKTLKDSEGPGRPPVNSGPTASLTDRLFRGFFAPLRRRFDKRERPQPRLALLERVALAPRHSLALVQAEGRRFLVATSTEGGPAFYALDSYDRPPRPRSPRVSW